MAKIIVLGSFSFDLVNFRGELIRSLAQRGHEVVCMAPAEPEDTIGEKIGALGARFISYPLDRAGMNVIADIRTIMHLRNLMRTLQPDLVLSYTIKPVIYGSFAAASVKRRPDTYSIISGLGYAFNTSTMLKKVFSSGIKVLCRHALKQNTNVFFQNTDDMNLFCELGIIRNHQAVLVNGSGVDLDYFAFTPPHTDPLSFTFVGRLIREKGIYDFIDAARLLKSRYGGIIFNVVGDIDQNPASITRDEITAWIREGIITFHGWLDDVRPVLRKTSVFVLPSFYREGQPRTALEAMSMGRPVITTDSVGCRDTVEHGINGYLVPARDSRALADAIETFITHPELIAEMGIHSRKRAEQVYDVHLVNRIIMDTMCCTNNSMRTDTCNRV